VGYVCEPCDGWEQVRVIPGRAAMDNNQHRQSRVPEPADKQFDAVRRDKLCTAFMLGFRHCTIMQAATHSQAESVIGVRWWPR
jgi:hypothetical protein